MTSPDAIRRKLTEIPDLYALIPDALITRRTGAQIRRPVPSSRPPLNLDVFLLDERRRLDRTGRMTHCDPEGVGVLPYLDGWARDIEATALDQRTDAPDELPDPATLTGIINWLLAELDYASTLPQWYDMSWGIQQLHANIRRAVANVLDNERPVTCTRCGAGHLRRIEGDRPLWECHTCGHLVRIQAVTLRQAAKILGRPYPTLIAWKNRNLITAVSDGPRKNLYDLGELRRVHAEVQLRGA